MKITNIGLLVLRVGFGLTMLLGHGLAKLSNFSQYTAQSPGLLGLSPKFIVGFAVFTEFFCALFVVLGLFTRWSAGLIAITMAGAVFVVHAADPFATRELASLYLIAFSAIAMMGAGELSLEAKRRRSW